jgi:hypothetical protein
VSIASADARHAHATLDGLEITVTVVMGLRELRRFALRRHPHDPALSLSSSASSAACSRSRGTCD